MTSPLETRIEEILIPIIGTTDNHTDTCMCDWCNVPRQLMSLIQEDREAIKRCGKEQSCSMCKEYLGRVK